MSKFETAMQEAKDLHQTLINEYASLLTVLERVKAGTVKPEQLVVNMADLTWAIGVAPEDQAIPATPQTT